MPGSSPSVHAAFTLIPTLTLHPHLPVAYLARRGVITSDGTGAAGFRGLCATSIALQAPGCEAWRAGGAYEAAEATVIAVAHQRRAHGDLGVLRRQGRQREQKLPL